MDSLEFILEVFLQHVESSVSLVGISLSRGTNPGLAVEMSKMLMVPDPLSGLLAELLLLLHNLFLHLKEFA